MLCWSEKMGGGGAARQNISFQGHAIKSEEAVKPLDVTLDNKLNFDTHISNRFKEAVTQLDVLKKVKIIYWI